MSDELCNRAVLKGLLSASGLDVDCDGSLISWPVFGGDSDTVTKFGDGGGSGSLKSIRDLAPR